MRLSEMLARSARPKRRRRQPPGILKAARLTTPIVLDRGRRVNADSTKRVNPKTVRSKRRNKVRAWQKKAIGDSRLAKN